jgi:hypothetical protein
VLLPLTVGVFLALHLLWIRRHGIVPPFPPDGVGFEGELEPAGPTKGESGSTPRSGTDKA